MRLKIKRECVYTFVSNKRCRYTLFLISMIAQDKPHLPLVTEQCRKKLFRVKLGIRFVCVFCNWVCAEQWVTLDTWKRSKITCLLIVYTLSSRICICKIEIYGMSCVNAVFVLRLQKWENTKKRQNRPALILFDDDQLGPLETKHFLNAARSTIIILKRQTDTHTHMHLKSIQKGLVWYRGDIQALSSISDRLYINIAFFKYRNLKVNIGGHFNNSAWKGTGAVYLHAASICRPWTPTCE